MGSERCHAGHVSVAARLEETVLQWTIDLLGLPRSLGAGFVTGTTAANLPRWPPLAMLHCSNAPDGTSRMASSTPAHRCRGRNEVRISCSRRQLLGLGRSITRVPVDKQGRMRPDDLPLLHDRTCFASGQATSTPAHSILPNRFVPETRAARASVHVDGAFGLWAGLSPRYAPLLARIQRPADSWAIDCHKVAQRPLQLGSCGCARTQTFQAAMSISAAYLAPSNKREPWHYVPRSSRRARAIEFGLPTFARSELD